MICYLLSRLVSLFLVLLHLSNDEEPILMKSNNNPPWDCTSTPAHPMPSTTLSCAHLTINANALAYVSEYTLTQTYVQAHCVQRHIKDNTFSCSLWNGAEGVFFKQRGIEIAIEEVKESVSEKERTHKGRLLESPLEKEKHKRLGIADRFHFSPLLLAACSLGALRAKGFADKHLTR